MQYMQRQVITEKSIFFYLLYEQFLQTFEGNMKQLTLLSFVLTLHFLSASKLFLFKIVSLVLCLCCSFKVCNLVFLFWSEIIFYVLLWYVNFTVHCFLCDFFFNHHLFQRLVEDSRSHYPSVIVQGTEQNLCFPQINGS